MVDIAIISVFVIKMAEALNNNYSKAKRRENILSATIVDVYLYRSRPMS